MRKVFLIWLSVISVCGYSQVDTTSPYIWVEEEVTDTAKAVEMAKQIVASENAQYKKEIDLLTYLKNNNKKKVKSDEDIAILKNIARRYESIITKQVVSSAKSSFSYALSMSSMPNERIQKSLEKGKIEKAFFNTFGDNITFLSAQIKDEKTYPYHSFANVVVMLPKKKVTVRKDNPNYGFRWLDDYDESKLKYNPVKEINTSVDFPQYVFRYKKMYDKLYLTVYDKKGDLVAVKYNTSHDIYEASIQKAGMKYDYEHNAYDINGENTDIRKALDDWFNDRSIQQKIDALQKKLAGISVSKQLAQNLLYNMVSNTDEYKAAKIVIDEYDKKGRAIGHQIEALKEKLPPADVQRSVDSYLRQLESDNENIWGWGQTYFTRKDGLNFILTKKDKTLKVQETYYIDEETEDLKCKYRVLNK